MGFNPLFNDPSRCGQVMCFVANQMLSSQPRQTSSSSAKTLWCMEYVQSVLFDQLYS